MAKYEGVSTYWPDVDVGDNHWEFIGLWDVSWLVTLVLLEGEMLWELVMTN